MSDETVELNTEISKPTGLLKGAYRAVEALNKVVTGRLGEEALNNTVGEGVDDRLGVVNVDDYNPTASFSAALSAAIDAAAPQRRRVVFGTPATYVVDDAIVKTDVSVDIDFTGIHLIRAAGVTRDPVLTARASVTHDVAVSALEAVSVPGSYGRATRVTVASSAGFAPGDYAIVYAQDKPVGQNPTRTSQVDGERVRIHSTTSTTITFETVLRAVLVTNIRVARMNAAVKVTIRNLSGEDAAYPTPTSPSRRPFIRLAQLVNPEVTNPRLRRLVSEGVEFVGCKDHRVTDGRFDYLITSSAGYTYGYGIIDRSGCDGVFRNVDGSNLRHVYTSGAGGLADGAYELAHDVVGATYGARITGGDGRNGEHPLYDFHEDAAHSVIDNCVVVNGHNHADGSYRAFQLRGRANSLLNCHSGNPAGFEFSSQDGGGDYTVDGLTHVQPAGAVAVDSFRVRGLGSERCRVKGGSYVYRGLGFTGNVMVLNKADLALESVVLNGRSVSEFALSIIAATDSRIYIESLTVDFDHTAAGITNIFSLSSIHSEIVIGTLKVRRNGGTVRIASMANTDSIVRVNTLIAPAGTLSTSLFQNPGAGAITSVGETIVGGVVQ